ncbi:TlpA disulfide reductase family protein [Paenimyroides aestuarii]|uniref:AhpC/TSA family protein n=1 Tax=Paenimyroides aestuarii TaxID=2968490 RepID=A0ABY5NQU7_9FLAO|nr:TlpA disulfide reductase family protein [Paenimyroides aestuarii]UUV20804.1 AhpC/TSA family protein [Paenimyroides aestuarii]
MKILEKVGILLPTFFVNMRKLFYFILLLIPCMLNAQHIIQGKIKNNKKTFKVYLKTFANNDYIKADSATVTNNYFEFKIPNDNRLVYLESTDLDSLVLKLYNTNGTTKIIYDLSNQSYKIKGTAINEGLAKYEKFIAPLVAELKNLSKQKPFIKNTSNFTIEERTAYNQHFWLTQIVKNRIELMQFDFINDNKDNAFSKILIAQKLNGVFKEIDYTYWERFYSNLNENERKTEKAIKLALFLREYESVKIGAKVAPFSLNDTNNTLQSLYENLGEKYTLIDFWSSWCMPCREENPNLVKIYKQYHTLGLNIIGISLDTQKDKWIQAIEKDQLTWLQLSNLRGWNEPLLKNFKVTAIPKTILLNKKGEIIAKDLRGLELEKKLETLFEK